ncbi:MAG: RidA family protein [Ferruginibacter sp.]
MGKRQIILSGTIWEKEIGYCRAIRVGHCIEVSGTTAMDGDQLIGKGDIYAQTVFIFQKIEKALLAGGASLKDVVRTRMYVTDISNWEQVGKAHALFFSAIQPAATMLEVKQLIKADLLIEIEVSAIVNE